MLPSRRPLLIDPDDLPDAADRIATLLADPADYTRLRDGAIGHWRTAPLYADHVAEYARALVPAYSTSRTPSANRT